MNGILNATDPVNLEKFQSEQVAHPKLIDSYNAVENACKNNKPGSIVTLLGPTGVGKTTLIKRFKEKIEAEFVKNLSAGLTDPGYLPIVLVEAPASSGIFDWKDFYSRLLEALYDPIGDRKIDYSKWETLPGDVEKVIQKPNSQIRVYRKAVEKASQHRRPRAVIIDEAQHLGKVGSGRALLDQLNIIKSLANITETTYVLCGTYEILDFVNLSDQLSRRSNEIHFQRYEAQNKSDADIFRNILWEFQNRLPVSKKPDLVENWKFFYERTLGCVGILFDWLERALKLSLSEGGLELTSGNIDSTALSVAKCKTIINQIILGEEALTENNEERNTLQQTLGLENTPVKITQPEKQKKGNRKPGTRKPTRDPVGVKAA